MQFLAPEIRTYAIFLCSALLLDVIRARVLISRRKSGSHVLIPDSQRKSRYPAGRNSASPWVCSIIGACKHPRLYLLNTQHLAIKYQPRPRPHHPRPGAPRRQRRSDTDGRGRSGRPLPIQPPREGGLPRCLGTRKHCCCCLDPVPLLRGGRGGTGTGSSTPAP